jgi:hypothetical protein
MYINVYSYTYIYLYRYPSFAAKEMNNFLSLLLEKDGSKRLENALGCVENDNGKPKGINYDCLRGHDFFKLGCVGGEGINALTTVEVLVPIYLFLVAFIIQICVDIIYRSFFLYLCLFGWSVRRTVCNFDCYSSK